MKRILLMMLALCNLLCYAAPTKVTRVIDGDTFETETGEKVRLIGINAPEITDVFGEDAKTYLSKLINGQTVELLPDRLSKDRDRYNRLLRYVIVRGVDINKKMLLDGYAFAYLKYHFDKEFEYKEAQLNGSENNKGIWGSNNTVKVAKQQETEHKHFFSTLTIKTYFLIVLVLILIFLGVYYYKK